MWASLAGFDTAIITNCHKTDTHIVMQSHVDISRAGSIGSFITHCGTNDTSIHSLTHQFPFPPLLILSYGFILEPGDHKPHRANSTS